jgi:2-desacetyl-2-hydroxyethyl bacteriochlorophyllide A dehydrogenase
VIIIKAIVKTSPTPGLDLKEVDKPKIGPDQILVKVMAAAVCGSDVHIYEWSPAFHFVPIPLTIGHEFSGQIAEVGANVKDFKEGDRVACNPTVYCGDCRQCKAARINICRDYRCLGVHQDGAFAEYVLIPEKIGGLYKLPDNISFEHAALLEPYCVAFHAYETSRVIAGDRVVVLGAGPIGLMIMQILKLSGVAHVTITGLGIDEYRLEVARKLGADQTINVEKENPVEIIKDITKGEGVDAVFEASGSPDIFPQALEMLRDGSEIIVVGLSPRPGNIDFKVVARREIQLKGARAYTVANWDSVIALMALEKIEVDPLITRKLAFERYIEGLTALEERKAIKVIMMP